jgi:hypothetical protein
MDPLISPTIYSVDPAVVVEIPTVEEPVGERWNFLPMEMVCSPLLRVVKSLPMGGDTSTQHAESGGGGSGGAIRLEGGSISIAGTLEAKGGNGLTATPGGGGRIAIKTNGNLTLGTIALDGHTSGTLHVSGATATSAINLSSGTLTFDTTHGYWHHTSGVHGTGVIEQKVDNAITYKTATFTFDSINLASGLTVKLQGENSLILKTRNHGNITVGTNLNANGGDADSNYPEHYSLIYQGLGRLGGYDGGYKNSSNGYGPGGGKFKGGGISGNLVGGGAGYGSIGQYHANDNTFGITYGDSALAHLHGGSGGGAGGNAGGGAGGGAISLEADGNGTLTIQSGATISANGGGVASTQVNGGGGGSGGSIRLAGKSITNNGSIQAKGGTPPNTTSTYDGGIGGGGRVSFSTSGNLDEGNVDVGTGAQQGTKGYNTPPTISSALSASVAYSNINYQKRTVTKYDDLVLWYTFDEADGSTAVDYSSSERNATLKNMSASNRVAGKMGGALSFDTPSTKLSSDPSGQHLDLGSWSLGGAFTLSTWIKADEWRSNGTILSLAGSETMQLRYKSVNERKLYFLLNDTAGGLENIDTENVLDWGKWIHLAITLENGGTNTSTSRVYKNGTLFATATDKTTPDSATRTPQYIGRSHSNSESYFAGDLDDFRLYNSALSAGDVFNIYAELSAGIHYQAQALNNPTGFSATGLPTGLSIDPTTGAITGLTTAVGDHNITLTASNLSGTSPSKNLILTVAPEKALFETEPITPANLLSLKLWLDAADTSTIIHSSNAVSKWSDKSGNNNHATQTNSSYQPVLNNSVLNSLPVTRFDGSDDVMTLSGDHTLQTFFLVLNARDGNNFGGWDWPMGGWTSWGNKKYVIFAREGYDSIMGLNMSINSGATSSDYINFSPLSEHKIVKVSFDTPASRSDWKIGDGDNHWNGDIAEIIAYSGTLSTFQIHKIEGYLAHKWGLVGDLPNGHPYKQSVTKQPKIAISSIGINSANITADLIDLGGAPTSLKVMFAEANGTVLETPETISSLQLWLDAADSSTIAQTSNSVSQWNDKSGNGYHASAAPGQEPTTGSSSINGKNVLAWGTSKAMSRTTPTNANWQDVYIVAQWNGGSSFSNHNGLFGGTTTKGLRGNSDYTGTSVKADGWFDNFYLNGSASSTSGVINTMSSAFIASISKDSAVSATGYKVGFDRGSSGSGWDGLIAEVLAFNTKLSDADRQKIEAYLAYKWGINGKLPSTHPYVASMPGSFENVSLGQTTMGLTGLSPSTTYNIRVQATNSGGSRLSDLVSFTTSAVPTPPVLSVSNPTAVGNTTATTKGNLLSFDGTTNPTITLYYGTSDGNQTPANWNGTSSPVSLSTKPVGPLDHNLTGLNAGTTYYFRYFATVTISGTAYSTYSDLGTFTTLGLPQIENPGATEITKTSAKLNAKLTLTNGNDSNVTFYWGDNNGSNNGNHNQWDNTLASSTNQGVGVVGQSISGLTTGTTYYYTAKAVNGQGTTWATVKTFVPANTAINKFSIPDLALWLDATDLDGNGAADSVSNGSALPSWTDKSVTPKTVNQTSSTEQPIVVSNAIGSKSVVRFDGNGDVLNVSYIRTAAGAYSVYAITQRISESGDTNGHLASEPTWALIPYSPADSFSAQVAKNSASSGASLTNIKLGKSGSSTSNDFGGDLAELFIFSRQLSSTEEQKVEGYLAHKWGVANTLDSNHTYKDIPPIFDNKPLIGNMSTATITTGQNVSIQIPATRNPTSWSATGLATGLSINNSGVISGTTTFIGDFNATVTATNTDGNDSKQISFTVTKGQRIIAWDQNFTNITYGDAPITLNATATGTGDLNYTSSDSQIIEINGTSAIIRGGGSVTLTANAAENSTAFAAIPVTKTISVAKAPLTITGQDLTLPVGTSIPDLNYTATGWKHNDASLGVAANPAAFSNLALWLDASDGSTLFANTTLSTPATSSVAGWKDKSGNANHATQSTSGDQPTITSNGMSGKAGLNFDNDKLSIPAIDIVGKTLLAVIQPDTSKTQQILSHSSINVQLRLSLSNQLQYAAVSPLYTNGTASSGTLANNQISFVSFTLDNTLGFSINGTFQDSGVNKGNSGASTFNQIGTNGASLERFNGKMGEIIIIDSVSSSDRQAIEGYLAHKWGLASSLPSNHSHKTVSLTKAPVVTTDATSSSSAGTYFIRPIGAQSKKYSFIYADGNLVLSSLTAQSITWGQDFSNASINQFIDLNATATSGLPVVYSVDQPSVADLAVTNQSSLHAWYKLDETGGVDAIDSSVYGSSAGHKGSLRNATGTPWNSGKFANAITLDGSNDHIRDYNFQGITGNARRTIALWFKTSTANKPLLQYGTSGTGTLFKLSLNGSGAVVLDLGGTSLTTSTTGLANGTWHHVAATIPANGNTGGAKLYINGTATNGSGSTAINTAATADLVIGRDGTSGSAYFNGQIDDVRLYGAELNATLISQLYGNGNGDFNRLKVVSAGTVTVTANQPGNGTYAVAPALTSTITIGKSDQTISFTPIPDKSVGDFDFSPTAVASSGLPVTFTSSDSLVAAVQGTAPNQTIKIRAAGTATITASQAGNGSFNPASSVTQSVTVGHFNLQANSFPGIRLWVDANNVDGDTTADNLSNGSLVTQWIDQSGNTNHPGASTNKPTYTASGLNGKAVLTFTQTQSMNLSSDSNIRVIAAVIKQNSSQTAATKPFGGDQTLTSTNQKFTLGAIDSGISTTSFRVVVWQMAPGAYSLHVDGTNKGSSTSSLTPAAFTKVGNNFAGSLAEIIAYDGALSNGVRQKVEGYLAHKWGLASNLPSSHAYAVGKPSFGGSQVLTFQPIPDKQAGQSVTLDVTSDSGLSAFTFDSNDSSVVSFSGNVATALKVGKVTITASQAGQAPWLSATASQPFIVTATPRVDQTITFADIPNKTVQSANFNLSASASSGLPVSFAVVSGTSATVESNGTVTITGAGVTTIRASQDGNGSYNPAPTVEKTLTVNKLDQTITFGSLSNASLTAGTYQLSATASSGLAVSFASSDNTVAEVSGTTLTLKQGGSIIITASQGGNGTYLAAPDVTQPLTVIDDTQQAQTITWTQTLGSRAFGVADLNLTASTNSGLPITYLSSDSTVAKIVNGSGADDVNGTYLRVVGAGTATITATQAGNGQYQAASPVAKSVTVTKANQEIVTNSGSTTLPDLTKDNGDFEFVPAVKSRNSSTLADTGLALTYSSSNSAVVEVTGSGAKLTPRGPGSATITVSQAGDATYNPANNATFSISVTENSPYSDSLSDLELWLDGKDINGDQLPESPGSFLANAKVSTWADRSGNGNTLAQSQTLNHPTYESSGGLTFDGNDFLSAALPSELQGNPAITVFLVADSQFAGGRMFQLGSNTGTANQVFGLHESGSVLYNDGNQTASQNFNPSPTLGAWRRSSGATKAEAEFFRFGSSTHLSSPSTANTLALPSSISNISLGNGHTGSGNDFFRGVVREVMIFSKALDNYNLQRIEGYLAHKWGAAASLPSDHQFKSVAPTFGGSQTITVAHTNFSTSDGLPCMSVFDPPFIPEGSYASSGLTLTYETNNSSILTVNAQGLLQPVAPGRVQVTLKQAGNSHFSAASNQTLDMKILGKRSQTITFASIPDKQPGGANFSVTASSSSGLPVTFTSEDNSTATVSGNTVTIVAAGTATIRATQAGNDTYAPAAQVEHSFMIGDPMSVSFEPVGTMGNNQSFKVRAWAYDATNGMLLNGKNGITMTYARVSGPATVSGSTVTTTGSGDVVIKVTVSGLNYAPGTANLTFTVDGSKQGQTITFLRGEKGGLGNLQLTNRPVALGRMASANSNLPITFELINNPNKIAKIIGSGSKAQLILAPKDASSSEKFSGFGGGKELTIKIRAKQAGDSSNWHAALSVDHEIKIKKPGKSAFYEARKLDERFDTKKAAFDTRMARLGKSGDKAAYLFNRDDQDSDGDGLTNLEERAFGGDSLMGDKRTAKPRAVRKNDGYEYITFKRYQDAYNTGDERIEYIVETSRDLRTWTTDSDSTNGPLQVGNAVDMGGGMEKVVYRSREKRTDNGGKQLYIRVRVKSK